MKASELIQRLQDLQEQVGDLDILLSIEDKGVSDKNISVSITSQVHEDESNSDWIVIFSKATT